MRIPILSAVAAAALAICLVPAAAQTTRNTDVKAPVAVLQHAAHNDAPDGVADPLDGANRQRTDGMPADGSKRPSSEGSDDRGVPNPQR
jgi:hypothetical protein